MTAFTRNDGSGTAVNNAYAFNHLYQMINQTVTKGGTTLQNLSYNFSPAQNNGQILSQTDAISGETVEYTYDALNRLATAATVDTSWGLEYTYDGFGNRTNQTLTKGSGPTHSVAIDATTNRINSAGYGYDANGNMTQMPLMTMTYDVANRMVTSNHSSAGNQIYGYNHANQRVFVRNGNTVTYYLYGMGGERLMEFQETCTGGACTSYTENQRWIYFAGRKMFSKTGSTLKAITPTRLASEAKHYPYGETQGTPPADTKDYFATYRRDDTGLDYAMNRYYSPTMGRFTTADRAEAFARLPESWNRYAYAANNPVAYVDPSGDYPVATSYCSETRCWTDIWWGDIYDDGRRVHDPRLRTELKGPYWVRPKMPLSKKAQSNLAKNAISKSPDNDCMALAEYASTLASLYAMEAIEAADFVGSFGITVPQDSFVELANFLGISISSTPDVPDADGVSAVYFGSFDLNSTTPSGYLPQYQDSGAPATDQGHHFAAFFQLGYLVGGLEGSITAELFDLLNRGDANLGVVATGLGQAFRTTGDANAVVNGIESLCRKEEE